MKEGNPIWQLRTWQKRLRPWRWENLVSQTFYSETALPVFGWFLTVGLIVGLFRTLHSVPEGEKSVKIPVDRVVKVFGLSGDGKVDSSAVAESVSHSAFDPDYGDVRDAMVSKEMEAWKSQSKPLRNREQSRGDGLRSEARTQKKKSRKKKKKAGSTKDMRKKLGKRFSSEDSKLDDDEREEPESALSGPAKTEFAESLPLSDVDEKSPESSGGRVTHVSPEVEVAGDASTVTGLEESEAGVSVLESQEAKSQAARSRGSKKKQSRTGSLQTDATLRWQSSQSTLRDSRKRKKGRGRSDMLSVGSSRDADPGELNTVTEHKEDWKLPFEEEEDGVGTAWLKSQMNKKKDRREKKRGARNLSS